MNKHRDDALAIVATALQVDPGSLDDTSAPGQTPGWDSLAHMRIVGALEERFERPLEPPIQNVGSTYLLPRVPTS